MKKQPQYAMLSCLTILLTVLATLTILPSPASKPDLLGYRTLCAFVPLSTLFLLGLAGFTYILRDTLYKTGPARQPADHHFEEDSPDSNKG